MSSPLQLLILPLLLLAAAKMTPPSVAAAAPSAQAGWGPASAPAPSPAPPPWPEQYHAVVITNQTARGGRLQQIDVYYDWPRGRAPNVIRDQLSSSVAGGGDPPLRDVQWANGTAFLFDAASCATFHFAVGLLPPDCFSGTGSSADGAAASP